MIALAAVPTDKQVKFAIAISEKLGIPLPEHETSKEYWQYIQDNREAYYDKVNAENGAEPKPKAEKPKSKWGRKK